MSFPLCLDSRIAQFYEYWNGLRIAGEIPGVATFDPIEVGPLLPSLWKLHWEEEPRDFVYRLAGEAVMTMFTEPPRHKTLGEVHDHELSETLRNRYQTVCRTPMAFYSRGQIYRHLGWHGTGERLALPLADNHGRPRIVIGCTVYSASLWPNPSMRPPEPEADIDVFTTLDGEPLERIRQAG